MSDKVPVTKKQALTKRDLDHSHKVGYEEGLQKGRQEILDFLQAAYIDDPGRPDRGTPKAEAILEVAKNAADHFQKKMKKGRRK